MSSNVFSLQDIIKSRKLTMEEQPPRVAAKQLSLQFDQPDELIFTYPHEFNSSQIFSSFLETQFIEVIFDLRTAPRLDFVAPDRQSAFRVFQRLQISYVDLLGRTEFSPGSKSIQNFKKVVQQITLELKKWQNKERPILLMFDDPSLYNFCGEEFIGKYEIINLNANALKKTNGDDEELLQM